MNGKGRWNGEEGEMEMGGEMKKEGGMEKGGGM